jgi:sarcosine oxidase subunit beta
MLKIIVVGGGINGVCTAYHLARTGIKTTLIEKNHLAAMASGWTLGGVRQSGRHLAELPLALAAVDEWESLSDHLRADTGYTRCGNMRLAKSEEEANYIRSMVELQRESGLIIDLIDGQEARRQAPALSKHIVLASLCMSDGFANAVATTKAYAEAACRYGASIIENCTAIKIIEKNSKIIGVETSSGYLDADCVVITAGIHTPSFLKPLGIELPLSIQCVHVAETAPIPQLFQHVFGVAKANCAGRQNHNGQFRYTTGIGPYHGNSEQWTVEDLKPTSECLNNLKYLVSEFIPALRDVEPENIWGGLIDLTPDALPVIDRLDKIDGLVVGAGFSGHGFGIAPSIGRILAALAAGKKIKHNIDAFRLDRFSRKQFQKNQKLTLNG